LGAEICHCGAPGLGEWRVVAIPVVLPNFPFRFPQPIVQYVDDCIQVCQLHFTLGHPLLLSDKRNGAVSGINKPVLDEFGGFIDDALLLGVRQSQTGKNRSEIGADAVKVVLRSVVVHLPVSLLDAISPG